MRILLLTTDTTHHAYYVWKLSERFPLQAIFLETTGTISRFETAHPFEKLRDTYERDVLLDGFSSTLEQLAETYRFPSVNSRESVAALQKLSPEVVIVFGTGKLHQSVIQIASVACLNLHGGNPEHYRGLDTHLWAIYHEDFDNLVTTLHHVDIDLDTGDIVCQAQIKLGRSVKLHELRAVNTKVCVNLSLVALNALQSVDSLPSRKQVSRGRYYSFMPSVLKEICVRKFERYTSKL